jgi:hypothetical protein
MRWNSCRTESRRQHWRCAEHPGFAMACPVALTRRIRWLRSILRALDALRAQGPCVRSETLISEARIANLLIALIGRRSWLRVKHPVTRVEALPGMRRIDDSLTLYRHQRPAIATEIRVGLGLKPGVFSNRLSLCRLRPYGNLIAFAP